MTKEQINNEALAVLKTFKRSSAHLSVGVGKTKLGLNHFELVLRKVQEKLFRDAKALVVAPRKKIIEGWKEEAEKWGLEHLLENITFSTYRSLTKQDLDYDVIYLDECHSLKNSHNSYLKNFQGYILGLTGTAPAYENSEKGKMVATYCPVKYTYLTDEAVNDKLLNDYKIIVHLLELSTDNTFKVEIKDKKTKKVTKSWMTSEKKHYDYYTTRCNEASTPKSKSFAGIMRMKQMHKFPTKDEYARDLLMSSNEKCILFANEKKQADNLCDHSYHSGNKNSKENLKMFEDGTITKLSCVDQLSEGANISGLKEIIIMHSYGNNRKAQQKLGRALRLSPEDTATIHILCFNNTVDWKWVKNALSHLNQDKIVWYDSDVF